MRRSPNDIMAKLLDCGFEVCEFELQSHYYVNSSTNTLGKVMNFLIPTAMG